MIDSLKNSNGNMILSMHFFYPKLRNKFLMYDTSNWLYDHIRKCHCLSSAFSVPSLGFHFLLEWMGRAIVSSEQAHLDHVVQKKREVKALFISL